MNHMPGGQPITLGDFGAAGFAAMERAASVEEPGPGGPVDRAIHATAAEQGCIRRVDDGVNAQGGDVGDDDFQPRRPKLARSQARKTALRRRQQR